MNRRAFLSLLSAAAAGEVGRRYFDIGASWAKALPAPTQGLMFHEDAVAVMLKDLAQYTLAVDKAYEAAWRRPIRLSSGLGVSIRLVQQFDVKNFTEPSADDLKLWWLGRVKG